MRALPVLFVSLWTTLWMTTLAACPRPPVGPPDNPPPAAGRVGPLAIEAFTQDRPAIAGKWFDYNPDGHTLSPKTQAWIVRTLDDDADVEQAPRHIALRIIDIYESDAAESGLFTFGLATFDDATSTWSGESEWVTPRNIKLTGQMCVDLFARAELPCVEEEAWQLRLALFQYLSTSAGLAVAEPGVFVHDARARVARVDDVADLAALAAAVPDPFALDTLDDAPPATWDGTDWPFTSLAPDLPLAGRAVGARFVDDPAGAFTGRDDVYWLITARFDLVRFTVRPVVDGDADAGLTFSSTSVEVSRDDFTAPDTMPAGTEHVVAVPAPGEGVWLTFDDASAVPGTLDVAPEHLVDTAWPHAPPKTSRFDLAVERTLDGTVHVLVSQGAAVLNATQLGLDEVVPPVSAP
jgi:hypothetical protein